MESELRAALEWEVKAETTAASKKCVCVCGGGGGRLTGAKASDLMVMMQHTVVQYKSKQNEGLSPLAFSKDAEK